VSEWLLVLWLTTLVSDRFDLLAGKGGFLITPFLILTPVVIALELFRLVGKGGKFRVPRNLPAYLLVASCFLIVVLVSVFYSFDIATATKRYALLVFQVYTTAVVLLFIAQRPDPRRILVRGAYGALGLSIVCNAVQLQSWFVRGGEPLILLGGMIDMSSHVYGPWLPRLSGPAGDMNRGGILALIHTYILLHLAPRTRMRRVVVTLASLGMVMSLSRSVLIGVLGTAGAGVLRRGRIVVTRRRVVLAALAIAVVAGGLLASPRTAAAVGSALEPITGRFSTREGSSEVHFGVMDRAVDLVTRSPKNALIGVGYGNAFAFLQDFFGDNKYGNFHSLYLTLAAECGGIGLFLGVLLIFYGAFRGGVYQPLLVGLACFNVFYQMGTEPIFWVALVLGWTRLGDPSLARGQPPPPRPPPVPAAARAPRIHSPPLISRG